MQGPSPDEVALVEAARQMGFEFKHRAQSSVLLDMLGEEVAYEVLNVMEYSSDRCRGWWRLMLSCKPASSANSKLMGLRLAAGGTLIARMTCKAPTF